MLMKRKILGLFLLSITCPFYAQNSNTPLEYPSTIGQLALVLDNVFSDEEITYDCSVDDFINENIRGNLGNEIAMLTSVRDNPLFWKNTNPKEYLVHKEVVRPIFLEWYWNYKHGIPFDVELSFECQDRMAKSSELPKLFPQADMIKDDSYIGVSYLFRDRYCMGYLYRYTIPQDDNIYLYSYHYGWFEISNEEYQNIITSSNYEEKLWNLLQGL